MAKKDISTAAAEPLDFGTLVTRLTEIHHQSQAEANRSVNRALVLRNWLFGWYIVEFEQYGADRAAYGEGLIKSLATELKPLGRGFSARSLASICSFYRSFSGILQTLSAKLDGDEKKISIVQTVSAQLPTGGRAEDVIGNLGRLPEFDRVLASPFAERFPLSWSHYVTLLTIDNADERSFYEIETSQNNWGVRELKRQINSSLYQRLALSRDKDEVRRLAGEGQVVSKAADLIKNPFVLEFLDLDEKAGYSERDLETEIIDKLQVFLLELGKGFLFEARQRRFTFDDDHYYVDLVLYNRLLRCYVLLDLKIGKLDHGDLGQMQMYVNYFDRHVKLDDELPTVGIVLCAHNNKAMVELTLPSNANIFASKYQLYLPSKEELKRELEKIEAEIDEFGLEAGE
ncbi:PDDEXK nuclease domain-containing protein [Allorhodopirellula solitaria]|uniref:DUF1016 domain-containing protein n=1 Tax=Allorhodopirellula solitaria TaxID=2527987 RepID=A0A5C5YGZ3_9BACT|nr:PDDEXK nuclease domain-containing protein [Allorhodopirellula solitaria]TWT74359.1 hypothetical protein CA85_12470 [Allorhodopirellula solitaria]